MLPTIKLSLDTRRAHYFFMKYGSSTMVGAIGRIVQSHADEIVSEVVQDMRRSSVPSAPGQAPGVRTGRLLRSLSVDYKRSMTGASATLGPTVDYGKYLEKGTRRMKPRPSLVPAKNRVQGRFYNALVEAVTELH